MDIQIDLWAVFLVLGIFQGIFITPLLFRRKTAAAKWLALLVLILSLHLSNYLAVNLRLYRTWPHFLDLTVPLLFLIGPVYYFYVRSLLDKQFAIGWKHLPHFVLVVLAFAGNMPFYMLSGAEKIERLDSSLRATSYNVSITFIIPIAIHVLQTLVYLVLADGYLKKINYSANLRNLELKKWLRRFTWGFGLYWIFDFLWMLYMTIANRFFHEVDYINVLSTAILVNALAYAVVYHNREFSQYLLALFSEKYKKSSLSPEQATGLLKKLMVLMKEEKLYLDADLKMSDLASKLSTSTNILSQVLNQETDKNFFEFVNEYRIAEAVSRLSDPQFSHISILGIAMDSGFSNKNTFNRLFKRHTGLTPTQFVRNLA